LNKGLTLKQKEAQRKKEIINSQHFQQWLEYRRSISPFPSNPYRAYMIDKGINADKRPSEEVWGRIVNRSDNYPVDTYQNGSPRERQPRRIPRKQKRRYERKEGRRKESRKLSKKELALKEISEKMSSHYGVPAPEVVFMKTGGSRSYASIPSFDALGRGTSVHIGSKGKLSPHLKAIMLHETGHTVHGSSTQEQMKAHGKMGFVESRYIRGGRIVREKTAWDLAEPFIKKMPSEGGARGIARWTKAWSALSYRKKGKARYDPVDPTSGTIHVSYGDEFSQGYKDFLKLNKKGLV